MPPHHARPAPAFSASRRRWVLTLIATFMMLVTSCSTRPSSRGVANDVHVLPADTIVFAPGANVQLEAFHAGVGGIPETVMWTSADPSIATVDAQGRATAIATGTTTITVTTPGNEHASATVTMIVSTPLSIETGLPRNGDAAIVAAMIDAVAAPATLETSADGTITISTATLAGNHGTSDADEASVTTTDTDTNEGFIEIEQGTVALKGSGYRPGSLVSLMAEPSGTTVHVARVGEDGTYHMTFDATHELPSGTTMLYVYGRRAVGAPIPTWSGLNNPSPPIKQILRNVHTRMGAWFERETKVYAVGATPKELTVPRGETGSVRVAIVADRNADRTVTWSSSDTTVATVDANGTVTGIAEGEATITITSRQDDTNTATVSVLVGPPPASAATSTVTISPNEVQAAGTATIAVELRSANDEPVTWSDGILTLTLEPATLGSIGPVSQQRNGRYVATFTAGTERGEGTLQANLDGERLSDAADVTVIEAGAEFFLADNGVTILCPDADVGSTGVVNDVTYTKISTRDVKALASSTTTWHQLETACTSGVTDFGMLFRVVHADPNAAQPSLPATFNRDIRHWDTSSATTFAHLFRGNVDFDQDISHWDVSGASNASSFPFDGMFDGATRFNQDLSAWCIPFPEPTGFDANTPAWTKPKPEFDCAPQP